MNSTDHLRAFAFAILGFGYALGVGFLAILLSGMGHGWNSANLSWLGIFVLPLFGVAIAYRHRTLLWIVAVAMLGIDLLVLIGANQEWEYLGKAWRHVPGTLILWTLGWVFWQFLVLFFLATSYTRSSGDFPSKRSQ